MGLQLPKRMPARARRIAVALVGAGSLLALSGCGVDSAELKRLGMPVISENATTNTEGQYQLWLWAWVAAMITGVLVWGLIGYAVVKYRRRSEDEIPVQTRYNLPLEILYTLAPVVMVLVFFYFTIDQQNRLDEKYDDPDHTIEVVGQQWSWTFNYIQDEALDGETSVFQPGDPGNAPTLYLPVNETVRFNFHSPDVIHDFWVPGFLQKMDVVPGRTNSFDLTPTREGTFVGKCAELCGVYHSRMLFNVEVVDAATYASKLRELQELGNIGVACGATDADTIAGLEIDPDAEPYVNDPLDANGACK